MNIPGHPGRLEANLTATNTISTNTKRRASTKTWHQYFVTFQIKHCPIFSSYCDKILSKDIVLSISLLSMTLGFEDPLITYFIFAQESIILI